MNAYCEACGHLVGTATVRMPRRYCSQACRALAGSHAGVHARDAVIFELYYACGMRPGQIAKLFGRSRTTIEAALARSR